MSIYADEADKIVDDGGVYEEETFTNTHPDTDREPVHIKGFKVTYDRKFNLGNFESLQAEISIWVKTRISENAPFNLHECKQRVRKMARENVREQYRRIRADDNFEFLGLEPPSVDSHIADPIYVATIGVGLTYKVNLGDYSMITPAYTDWADLRAVALEPQTGLHTAVARLWEGLWANLNDEIARARGEESDEENFGLPVMEVEELMDAPLLPVNRNGHNGNGHHNGNGRSHQNGHR